MKFLNIFKLNYIFPIMAALLFYGGAANGQTPPQNRAQLSQRQIQQQQNQKLYSAARSLLRVGRYSDAENMLKTLLKSEPDNVSYYQTLLDAYLSRGANDEAKLLVEEKISANPNDPRFEIDLGNVWYRMEKKDEARQLWDGILREQPKNLSFYNYVATAMLQNRLLDEPIEIYLRAVQNIPGAHFLFQNIATLYASRLMYARASFYYLKYLEANPNQRNYVFGRILAMPVEEEDQAKFVSEISAFEKELKLEQPLALLVAQLHQKHGDFDAAFSIYRTLDQKLKDERYFVQFGKAAQQDSAFIFAARAYELFMQNYPKSRQLPGVEYEYIKCLYALARVQNREEYGAQANAFIEKITGDAKGHPFWDRIKYTQGSFYLDFYFDLDQAIGTFREILARRNVSEKMIAQTRLKLARAQSIKGDLAAAEATLEKVQTASERGEALLALAEIYYFQKNWTAAGETIDRIIGGEGVASEAANDALNLQFKLQLAESAPGALALLSEADYLLRQRKKSEVARKYREMLTVENLPPDLKSDALGNMTKINADLQNYAAAMENCQQALSDTALIDFYDRHLLLMGGLLENQLERPRAAFDAYQELLKSYPNSILAENARERLRALRQSNPTELP